jgi:hypothetical protein
VKHSVFLFLSVLVASVAWAQGPVLHQADLWTFPYEDLSDLLRLYPGMYPLDYGTIGQPVLFRPWNLNPWELQVDRDGIPQNRHYDGLYDANLQPGAEIDTIRYDFLERGGAGRFELTTRNLPVDSPYTEVQIREGYYGYGTVDFGQGEKIYKSTTLELTGRLLYYNGMRDQSAAKFRRIRGKIGFNLGARWRGNIAYAGSNDASNSFLDSTGLYAERRDAILSIAENDTLRSHLSPSLQLYARQDREKWGNPFHAREFTKGSVLQVHATLPGQRFLFRQLNSLSTINFPGFRERHELWIELHGQDSVGVGFGALNVSGSIRRESDWGIGIPDENTTLVGGGVEYVSPAVNDFTLHGGTQYTEEIVPMAWRFGSYLLTDRPLQVSPDFADESLAYQSLLTGQSPGKDHYWKSDVGIRWNVRGGYVDATAMALKRPGEFRNRFLVASGTQGQYIFMDYSKVGADTAQFGIALDAQIPLVYGLRVDSWWFRQANANDLGFSEDSRGYTRLYFEHAYFQTPLIIRAHISWQYYGQRLAYSNYGTSYLGPNNVIGFRISATIKGVTAVWGTENFTNEYYHILPGYKMIGKEEYLGFIVRLWL